VNDSYKASVRSLVDLWKNRNNSWSCRERRMEGWWIVETA